MSTLVDANVLLELLLPGRPKPEVAAQYLSTTNDLALSPLTAHLYIYFGKKGGVELDMLLEDMESYNFTSFGKEELMWAISNRQSSDFEDAIQVACAVLHGCTSLATFDKRLANRYGHFIDVTIL